MEMEATRVWYEMATELEQYGNQRYSIRTQKFVEIMLQRWQDHLVQPSAESRAALQTSVSEADAALGLLKLSRN